MTQTLRRQRKQKFIEILSELLDAAESRTEKQTDEEAGGYNVELMRGDFHEYPEHLWEYARVLRDTWMMRLPDKPKKGSKESKYTFYIVSMDGIKSACAEFGADVLVKVHADWKAKFKDGIAPYTVANPQSLVKVCEAKAMELRQTKETKTAVKRDESGMPESW